MRRRSPWESLKVLLLWVADAGAPQGEGPDTRRVRVLNLSALSGVVFNTGFTLLLVIINIDAIRPLLLPNFASSLAYLVTILLTAAGRQRTAIWVLFLTAVTNLMTNGYYFGLESFSWLYLMILPVTGALFVPRGDRLLTAVVLGGGSVAVGVVPLIAGEPPPALAGSAMNQFVLFFIPMTTALILAGIAFYYRSVAERAEARSEQLLLNILPRDIAERLKSGESPIADRIPEVTVLFGDIVGSTSMADRMSPDQLVTGLNRLFSVFDDIADEFGLEKIKTVGDEYFAVAGLDNDPNHCAAAAQAALAMRDELGSHPSVELGELQMRFGLHSGSVVAGVIGKRKFSYDLWGDTVNIASRMESSSEINAIQVSAEVFNRIKDRFRFESRGPVPIKGIGTMKTYLLIGPR